MTIIILVWSMGYFFYWLAWAFRLVTGRVVA